MRIPYDKLELQIALLGISEEAFTDEKMKELEEEISNYLPSDKADINKEVAEFHGITVKDLIDSPNYGVLCGEHSENMARKFVAKLVEKLSITEKQAWAILADMIGLI